MAQNENQMMQIIAKSADAISEGDTFNRRVRMKQQWSLAPAAALLSTIFPAAYIRYAAPELACPIHCSAIQSRTMAVVVHLHSWHIALRLSFIFFVTLPEPEMLCAHKWLPVGRVKQGLLQPHAISL